MEYKIALVGNPNVGKTSLYNRITHSLEHVGNWHGVTVGEVSKTIEYEGKTITLTDLPGLYSLTPYSPEEAISRDAVISGSYDLVVCVCESGNLMRNLYLCVQLLETGVKTLLVVNMMDEMHRKGKSLDAGSLESRLGIPVVPMSAKYGTDVGTFLKRATDCVEKNSARVTLPYFKKPVVDEIARTIKPYADRANVNASWAAIKFLENDEFISDKLSLPETEKYNFNTNIDGQSFVAKERYEFIETLIDGIVIDLSNKNRKRNGVVKPVKSCDFTSVIDRAVLNRYAALPIFFAIMCGIFYVTFGPLGSFLSGLFDKFFEFCFYKPLTGKMLSDGAPEWAIGLVGDGIISGLGGVLKFLPQVALLFFFLAVMEDSGYVSRVAFMTDGLFGKIGLSGRAVFTMIMGFGCSATAVLTARGLDDENMRKKTVIITPFMSCSARLPVYTVIAGAYFSGGAVPVIALLYVLGIFIAVTCAAVFEKHTKRLKSGKTSFIMEMPPYRIPTAERILQILAHNAKVFLIKVGTLIFALNVLVWFLTNFSFRNGYVSGGEGSILASVAGAVSPIFAPLGFGNWRAVAALLSGFVAKEAVVSSIESFGGINTVFCETNAVLGAITFLVYTLLYVPCVATLSAEIKEVGIKWTAFGLVLQLATAYLVAFIVHTIGLAVIVYGSAAIWTMTAVMLVVAASIMLASGLKERNVCGYYGKKGACDGSCCCGIYSKKREVKRKTLK